MELVNIVSVGEINREVDLDALAQDLDIYSIDYSPNDFPGATIKSSPDSPTILLFRSGKYTVTGASNQNEIEETLQLFKQELNNLDIIDLDFDLGAEIVNRVYTDNIELDIDLDVLPVVLGFENTEYEPEISPFVIYHPEQTSCVITISSSGNIVITGITDGSSAESALHELTSLIEERKYG